MTNKERATVSVQHNEDNLSKEQLNEDIRSTEVANNQMKIQSTLHQKLQKKLEGGRFRWINEQLYTSTGSKALDLFRKDPHLFDVYHKGFGLQVQSWPKNPVHVMIRWLQQRPSTLVVADFGCGDAVLAQNVCNKVHSFDLVAKNQHVTVCDMANVPLPNSSVDIAVFCLSLMGTNLLDFLKEAHRVLKPGGILKVAEVVSRFEDLDTFLKCLTQLGFQLNEKDESNKMFVLFEMTKVGKLNKKLKMEDLQLKACIYKKR